MADFPKPLSDKGFCGVLLIKISLGRDLTYPNTFGEENVK